ncbi:DNA topoisomerase IV subunit A [Candidatus Woesearchaeota archaeon]|nr:DNA topoisomerase IV subunit A [Candidatus Woesearchaeota archaeon]
MAKKQDRKTVLDGIQNIASDVYSSIMKKKAPKIKMPLRSLNNVKYDQKKGFFELLGKFKARTLTASTIKTFAQTLLLMNESKRLAKDEDRASKREMYYVSKNWGEARFDTDSDAFTVMDDVEAMLQVNREQMSIFPEERGGSIAGKLIVIDGKDRIDCTKFGSGAYSIPSSVEDLKFETKAKFILVVETSALFDRLNHHRYWEKANCIVIAMMGVPTRATRRFIRRLADDKKLPVYVFTDGDPYGYLNIYRTLKVGSGNAAHINEYFCVPQAQFLGVTPKDIIDYNLPSHPLKEVDIKRLKDGIKNDPFVKTHKEWQKALALMAKHKKRAEQQAFAAKTLNYVYEVYLPEKLKDRKTWLP